MLAVPGMAWHQGTAAPDDTKGYEYFVVGNPDLEGWKGFVDLPLCTPQGLETRRALRRDKAAYKKAKALDWGDAV